MGLKSILEKGHYGRGIALIVAVVAFRLANALIITTSFAPDEYYQAMEPAYLYATGRLWPAAPGDVVLPSLRSFRQLSWEWASDEALRPSTPVLALAQIHRLLLWAEHRCMITPWAAGFLHARAARLVGGVLAATVDLSTPYLASRLLGMRGESPSSNQAPSSVIISTARRHALVWSLLSHWIFFALPRPLVNSWEAALTTVGIACVMSANTRTSAVGVICAAFALVFRASSLPLWVVVLMWKRAAMKGPRSALLSKAVPSAVIGFGRWLSTVAAPLLVLSAVFTAVVDSYWYGSYGKMIREQAYGVCSPEEAAADAQPSYWRWLLASLEQNFRWSPVGWVRFNALRANDAASLFGTHPLHWYVSAGAWALAAPQLIVLLVFLCQSGSSVKRGAQRAFWHSIGGDWHWGWLASISYVIVHSVVPHKEERFLTPLVPIVNAYAAIATARVSLGAFSSAAGAKAPQSQNRRRKGSGLACLVLLAISSAGVAYYLTRRHQAAPELSFHNLRNRLLALESSRGVKRRDTHSLHVLAPCFSTPGLAFLHGTTAVCGSNQNAAGEPLIEAWMLECDHRTSFFVNNGTTRSHGAADSASRRSASERFMRQPHTEAMDIYHRASDFPDYLATWESAPSKRNIAAQNEQGEEELFARWVAQHFEEISREFHGNFYTFGASYFVIWRRRPAE